MITYYLIAFLIIAVVVILALLFPLQRNRATESVFDYFEIVGTRRDAKAKRYYLPVVELVPEQPEYLRRIARMNERFAARGLKA